MINHAENLWQAFKRGQCPDTHGEQEKLLKVAFLMGMGAGHQMSLDAVTSLNNNESVRFFVELRQMIAGGLGELGKEVPKISLFTMPATGPKVTASINGEKIP